MKPRLKRLHPSGDYERWSVTYPNGQVRSVVFHANGAETNWKNLMGFVRMYALQMSLI